MGEGSEAGSWKKQPGRFATKSTKNAKMGKGARLEVSRRWAVGGQPFDRLRAGDGGQRSGGRDQRPEDRGQGAEARGQRPEDRGQRSVVCRLRSFFDLIHPRDEAVGGYSIGREL